MKLGLPELPDFSKMQAESAAQMEKLKAERDEMLQLAEARHRETQRKLNRILAHLDGDDA